MGRESIETALKNFGLTEKEGEVYLFLAKLGPQKTGQIAKQLNKNKGLIYRILKSLQKKGLVEATLEAPTRYTPVPFEKVIDSYIKTKREEASIIEESKNNLLFDWNEISQTELDSSIEKFSVIEGNKKIFQRITQMVNGTNNRFSITLTLSELLRAEQFGVFDSVQEQVMKSQIQFQVLTKISKENLKSIKLLKTKLNPVFEFRGINPSLGLSKFSRMAIRDGEEMVLFLSEKNEVSLKYGKEVCLYTNCKSINNALLNAFDDLWKESITIEEGVMQIETGKPIPQMLLIKDSKIVKRKFDEVLGHSQKEIFIVTSSDGLGRFKDWLLRLRKTKNHALSIKIMAPIVERNLEVSQELLEFCEVKHIPSSYIGTVIIDGKHLFQFKHSSLVATSDSEQIFINTFYTNDVEYIEKTWNMFNDLWKKAPTPSSDYTINKIFEPNKSQFEFEASDFTPLLNFRKVITFSIENPDESQQLTEKDVINRLLRAKTGNKSTSKEPFNFFASTAQAIIHPPTQFGLPDLMLHAFHVDEHSAHGAKNSLVIFLWLQTPSGYGFVPVALVGNTSQEKLTKVFAGTPAQYNFHLLRSDRFYVRIHGNTLFSGWTENIPLFQKYVLPPSCFSVEGSGKVKTGSMELVYRSGFKASIQFNALEGLVTFYHPTSKYSGPGSDGILFREYIGKRYIP